MVGKKAPEELVRPLLDGADEIDLVRSGLDDTMRAGYNATREAMLGRNEVPDLRTAAFVVALEKIARSYDEMGLA